MCMELFGFIVNSIVFRVCINRNAKNSLKQKEGAVALLNKREKTKHFSQ